MEKQGGKEWNRHHWWTVSIPFYSCLHIEKRTLKELSLGGKASVSECCLYSGAENVPGTDAAMSTGDWGGKYMAKGLLQIWHVSAGSVTSPPPVCLLYRTALHGNSWLKAQGTLSSSTFLAVLLYRTRGKVCRQPGCSGWIVLTLRIQGSECQ